MVENVNVGKWKIRNFFYQTPEIRKWGLIYIGNQLSNEQKRMIEYFAVEFPKVNFLFFDLFSSKRQNICFLQELRRKGLIIRANLEVTYKTPCEREVEESLIAAHRNGCQLAIIILNTSVPQVYPFIKQMGNQKLGLKTQCIDMNTIQKNINNLWMRKFSSLVF